MHNTWIFTNKQLQQTTVPDTSDWIWNGHESAGNLRPSYIYSARRHAQFVSTSSLQMEETITVTVPPDAHTSPRDFYVIRGCLVAWISWQLRQTVCTWTSCQRAVKRGTNTGIKTHREPWVVWNKSLCQPRLHPPTALLRCANVTGTGNHPSRWAKIIYSTQSYLRSSR